MKLIKKHIAIILFAIFSFPTQVIWAQHREVPKKYINEEMTVEAPQRNRFSGTDIRSREFVDKKNSEWRACHQENSFYAPFAGARDPITKFIESDLIIRDLKTAEENSLLAGGVTKMPWSGDYWPYANGILGVRYLDSDFSQREDWLQKFEYVRSYPANKVIEEQGQSGISILSTSEKYDLLVGDQNFNLTDSMWQQGKQYYDEYGKVEIWMGICHGWAPAAIFENRPSKSVEIPSQNDMWKVHLNPSEIKGLVSYSWATNPYPTLTLGERCNQKNPPTNNEGRILTPECFDLNPATWHLAVINRLGMQKRSFVMDATYDYEVWNQPIVKYSYSYFNPQTGQEKKSWSDAIITRSAFTKDRFASYRAPSADQIIGIKMKVAYVIETAMNDLEEDLPEYDAIRWVEYLYDLEIDRDGKIVGGEWHLQSHPDFIWVPRVNSAPYSPMDKSLDITAWDGISKLPQDWAEAARVSSPQGVMINTISRSILRQASTPN